MNTRTAKRRAQQKHGHYDVHSYRQSGDEASKFTGVPPTRREVRQSDRVRVGISHSKPWRDHV